MCAIFTLFLLVLSWLYFITDQARVTAAGYSAAKVDDVIKEICEASEQIVRTQYFSAFDDTNGKRFYHGLLRLIKTIVEADPLLRKYSETVDWANCREQIPYLQSVKMINIEDDRLKG